MENKKVLSCDNARYEAIFGAGRQSCNGAVSYIDDKGFIYCETCGKNRQLYRKCRKLKPHEVTRLQSGQPLKRY